MNTSVALIIFNRPDTTERVFRQIAAARPPKLFVIADGPRPDHPEDQEKCAAARAVIENVDWPCAVFRDYSPVNLGCGRRPVTGINWVFDQVEEAIILEDDCVPDSSFFRFCGELLDRFRTDARVVQVCGNNFQFGRRRGPDSYFFSYHNICAGGWATWRRAWDCNDMAVKSWPRLKSVGWLHQILNNPKAEAYWAEQFDRAHEMGGMLDYWDYQWTFACWARGGLSILPNRTLVSNIGFRPDGTHTKGVDITANLPLEPMPFPLKHPTRIVRHRRADEFFVTRIVARETSPLDRLRIKVSEVTPVSAKNQLRAIRMHLHAAIDELLG